MRHWLGVVFGAAILLIAGFGVGRFLDGAPSSAQSTCVYSGGGPPFNMQSFEVDRSRALILDAQRLAAANQLFPTDSDFQLQPLKVGEQRIENPSATIPAEILFAIGWVESKSNQTSIEVAYGTLGPALVSWDCGYGVMQVTSTIVNDGGLPSRYEALVGSHFAYNVAAGAQILVEKWNEPLYPIVGDHDPAYIESWYYALWAYNGWAGVNHPRHPTRDPMRAQYRCDEVNRHTYPYQELVLGCLINPPAVESQRLWQPVEIKHPDLAALTAPGGPLDLDTFYAGLDEIYVSVAATSAFAEMNMPLPAGAVRRTPVNPADAAILRQRLLGQPAARLDATELELTSTQLAAGGTSLQIHNDGTGLLAWRVVDAPSWLSLDISAGVALGTGYPFAAPAPSSLKLSAAADGVPEGSHRGAITLAFDYPDRRTETQSVTIFLDKQGAAYYEAGNPQS